jgi:hypothetical protein
LAKARRGRSRDCRVNDKIAHQGDNARHRAQDYEKLAKRAEQRAGEPHLNLAFNQIHLSSTVWNFDPDQIQILRLQSIVFSD